MFAYSRAFSRICTRRQPHLKHLLQVSRNNNQQIMDFIHCVALLVLVNVASLSAAFMGRSDASRHAIAHSTRTTLMSLAAGKDTDGKICFVQFSANKTVATECVPVPADGLSSVLNFFERDENRNLLLSAGKRNGPNVAQIEERDELMSMFQEESKLQGISDEESKCGVIKFLDVGSPTQFPGLSVTSINTMSSRFITNDDGMPEYQFTLLDSTQDAKGAPPLVWLFKKLTGSGNGVTHAGNSDVDAKKGSSSFTRVYVVPSEDDRVISFEANATLDIVVKFPSVMMKLLPVNIEKFEEQGSASIQKVLDKSIRPSIELFVEAYKKWLT